MATGSTPTFVELAWTFDEGVRIRFVHDEIPAADGDEALAQLERVVEMIRLAHDQVTVDDGADLTGGHQ